MAKIILKLNKSLEENASDYFERSKKMKKKIEGAKKTIEMYRKKLVALERKKAVEKEQYEEVMAKQQLTRKKEWYEKFRWFFTSEGFLVIGGRDATTNEIIVKKHAEKNDIVFHTDLAGSPFFLIKTEGKKPKEQSLKEVANATVSFSRVFKLGTSTSPVFYVKPEQVTKEAKSGEYLTKGAFVIKGKTNYIDNQIDVAIGIREGVLMCAPVSAVKAHCKEYLVIIKGEKKPSEIAKKIKNKLGGSLDEIIRILPSGNMDIQKK